MLRCGLGNAVGCYCRPRAQMLRKCLSPLRSTGNETDTPLSVKGTGRSVVVRTGSLAQLACNDVRTALDIVIAWRLAHCGSGISL